MTLGETLRVTPGSISKVSILNISLKVTHNTCSLHLVSNFQNSSKHTKPSIENSTSLW